MLTPWREEMALSRRKGFTGPMASGAIILTLIIYPKTLEVSAPERRLHQSIAQQTCIQIHNADDINSARAIAAANAKYLFEAAEQEGSLDKFAERCFIISADPGWWLGEQ
jgi:hypothetical protein